MTLGDLASGTQGVILFRQRSQNRPDLVFFKTKLKFSSPGTTKFGTVTHILTSSQKFMGPVTYADTV